MFEEDFSQMNVVVEVEGTERIHAVKRSALHGATLEAIGKEIRVDEGWL